MDQTAIRMTDVGKFPIPFFENNMKKNIMFTLVTTIECLDIRAITWNKSVYPCKNVLLFFRDLLPGIWMPFQECVETRPTLICMILIAPSKREISYKISALS